MLNKILVALDFSDASEKVVDFAKNMSVDTGAELHFIHVVEPHTSYEIYGYTDHESTILNQYVDLAFGRAREHMKKLVDSLPPSIKRTHKVIHGCVPSDLLEEAEKSGLDSMIVGSHGHGLLVTLLGSTAEKLVRSAKLPIFVVPIHQ